MPTPVCLLTVTKRTREAPLKILSALWVCLDTPYHRAWAATLPFFDEVFLVSWARNRIALACKSSPDVACFKRRRYLAALWFGTESSTCTCWTQTRRRAIGYTVQVSKKRARAPQAKRICRRRSLCIGWKNHFKSSSALTEWAPQCFFMFWICVARVCGQLYAVRNNIFVGYRVSAILAICWLTVSRTRK